MFTPGASYTIDNQPVSVAIADFNGDGKLDIAVADSQGIGIAVLLGNGDGTFQPAVFYSTFFPGWVVAADVNGDGKPDLMVAGAGPNLAGAVTVFLGIGDGSFKPGIAYPAGGSSLAVGDFNGDGLLDVASADGRASVTVLLNTGVVSFSPTTPLTFASQLVGSSSSGRSVILTSTGATPLSIASLAVKGPFQLSRKTTCFGYIAPGTSCVIAATFHPTVKGTVGGLVSISDSASSKPQIIQLTGTGTVVSIQPLQLNFGSQKIGTRSAPQVATLQNQGSTALDIASIATRLTIRTPAPAASKSHPVQAAPSQSCSRPPDPAPETPRARSPMTAAPVPRRYSSPELEPKGGRSGKVTCLCGHDSRPSQSARVGKAVEIKGSGQPPVKVKLSGQECPLYRLERSEKPAWERYRVTRFGTKPTRFVVGDVL